MDLAIRAREIFEQVCRALTEGNLKYDPNPENLTLKARFGGEGLSIDAILLVREKPQLITVLLPLSFTIPESKRMDAAVAINVINNRLLNGSFDYSMDKGEVVFRINTGYCDSRLGNELIRQLLYTGVSTVGQYDEKLLGLTQGMISLEDFVKQELQ